MKWLGQHIVDLIARFRSTVYLEELADPGTDTDKFLVSDSDGKVGYRTGSEVLSDLGIASDEILDWTVDQSATDTIHADNIPTLNQNTTGTAATVTAGTQAAITTCANLTTVGTIGTGTWNGTAIASNYLDSDTAHLSGIQTFIGPRTFAAGIIYDGDRSTTPGDGAAIHVDASDITDNNTSASGTAAAFNHVNIENPRVMASNALVTTTNAATVFIKGAPVASTNQTITNSYALLVAGGNVDISTVTAGTWNGTAIASAYLDADTAHLTTAQTFTGSKTMGTTVKLNFRDGNSYIYSPTANDLEIVATDIVLDAATSISLENDTTVTGNLTATRKYELPLSAVGAHSGGDVYYYGDGSTVKGKIYYINGTNWTLADADAEASTSGLLAVALGTDPDVDGMLLRGFVTLLTEVEGTEAIGSPIYLSATNSGVATITVPGSGDFVRVLGYSLHATENQVYFNPDNTWVEVA